MILFHLSLFFLILLLVGSDHLNLMVHTKKWIFSSLLATKENFCTSYTAMYSLHIYVLVYSCVCLLATCISVSANVHAMYWSYRSYMLHPVQFWRASGNYFCMLIKILLKEITDSDWLRAAQLKCNISANYNVPRNLKTANSHPRF